MVFEEENASRDGEPSAPLAPRPAVCVPDGTPWQLANRGAAAIYGPARLKPDGDLPRRHDRGDVDATRPLYFSASATFFGGENLTTQSRPGLDYS